MQNTTKPTELSVGSGSINAPAKTVSESGRRRRSSCKKGTGKAVCADTIGSDIQKKPSVPNGTAVISGTKRKSFPAKCTAYIDTEFNAFDYYGQNGGHQEILQVGAVIISNLEVIDSFSSFCRLRPGHVLSKRAEKLTGISAKDLKTAPSFPEVLEELNSFFAGYSPVSVFAYGNEDRLQLLNTAALYGIKKDGLKYINRIEDNMKQLRALLRIKKRSNLSLSVGDLCDICGIKASHMHDAYNDALNLGKCSELIRRSAFEPEQVDRVLEKKVWMSNYRMARRIKECRDGVILDDADLKPMKALIDNLKEDGYYPDYLLQAIFDDLLMITGRTPGDI